MILRRPLPSDVEADPARRRAGDVVLGVIEEGSAVLVANAPDADLTRPFFIDAVAELARRDVPARAVPTIEFIRNAPPHRVAGFVFHTSRCGSTLLCSALEATGCFLVLREPGTFNSVLSPPRPVAPRRQLLAASLGWYSSLASERELDLVVKLPSMASMVARDLCAAFPTTNAIALVRHPGRMIASMLRNPAESRDWVMSEDATARLAAQIGRSRAGGRSEAVRWAAVWASMVEELVPLVAGGAIRVLTYEAVVDRLVAQTAAIAAQWTSRPLATGAFAAIEAAGARDAKRPERAYDPLDASRTGLSPAEWFDVAPVVEPALGLLAEAGAPLRDL